MPDFLPFALPDISDVEIFEVVDALKSGFIRQGRMKGDLRKPLLRFVSS
jgi:hypothetical protein